MVKIRPSRSLYWALLRRSEPVISLPPSLQIRCYQKKKMILKRYFSYPSRLLHATYRSSWRTWLGVSFHSLSCVKFILHDDLSISCIINAFLSAECVFALCQMRQKQDELLLCICSSLIKTTLALLFLEMHLENLTLPVSYAIGWQVGKALQSVCGVRTCSQQVQ